MFRALVLEIALCHEQYGLGLASGSLRSFCKTSVSRGRPPNKKARQPLLRSPWPQHMRSICQPGEFRMHAWPSWVSSSAPGTLFRRPARGRVGRGGLESSPQVADEDACQWSTQKPGAGIGDRPTVVGRRALGLCSCSPMLALTPLHGLLCRSGRSSRGFGSQLQPQRRNRTALGRQSSSRRSDNLESGAAFLVPPQQKLFHAHFH